MKQFYVESTDLDAFIIIGQTYPSATIAIKKQIGKTVVVTVIETSDLEDEND